VSELYVSGGCPSVAYTEQLEQNLRESAVLCLEARTFSIHLQCRGTAREVSHENTVILGYLPPPPPKKNTVCTPNRFVFARCSVVILPWAYTCIVLPGVRVVPHFIQASVGMVPVISLPSTSFTSICRCIFSHNLRLGT
jgi:hypothetical protein